MNLPTCVCPLEPDLLAQLHGRHIVVRVPEAAQIPAAALAVANSGNTLHHVLVDAQPPFDRLPLKAQWFTAPAILVTPEIGPFRKLAAAVPVLREAAVAVWLACRPENLISIRLLSSLGIASGVLFDDQTPPWESLIDLMTYCLLGPTPHAPIEPFASIARHYATGESQPSPVFDWNRVYFDDPAEFLHLDRTGRVALSRRDLLNGQFAGQNLDDPNLPAAIEARRYAWQQLFVDNRPCSRCPGWRICQGKFVNETAAPPAGCSEFIAEMMDVIETRRTVGPARRGTP